jgi:2-(1,2-epoxy-1,2-dihydrophenyl)acetyl-CoA isomerase
MTSAVTLAVEGGVALLTLNRPERANVIDGDFTTAMAAVLLQVSEGVTKGQVRAVLLQARGAQFCAGGDIAGMVKAGDQLAAMMDSGLPALNDIILRLATLPVPLISAVQGSVGGGGIGLALSADIVLAAESMKLRGGYTAIGLSPDVGASWLLTRRVGPQRAKHLFT